jgi:hypothetical protein
MSSGSRKRSTIKNPSRRYVSIWAALGSCTRAVYWRDWVPPWFARDYSECMSKRARIAWFGGSAALVLAGVACAVAIPTTTGQVLAMGAIGIGLVLALSLVFFEVGLSDDRERARATTPGATELRGANRPANAGGPERPGSRRQIRRPRIERSRGHRHRLR